MTAPDRSTGQPDAAAPQAPAAGMAAIGPGHNGGPALDADEADPDAMWRLFCWRKAHAKAWKTPPREIALRRLARAEELGMTYREYTLEILDRGRFL